MMVRMSWSGIRTLSGVIDGCCSGVLLRITCCICDSIGEEYEVVGDFDAVSVSVVIGISVFAVSLCFVYIL